MRASHLALLLVLSWRPLDAQSAGATITGVVRDSLGVPVAGAEVVATSAHRTRSDSAGRFRLDGLASGGYTVRARKLGYEPAEWTAEVGRTSRFDITLTLTRTFGLDTVF